MIPDPPLPETYWVIPERFLAGPYPAAGDEETARERLQSLLDAGIQVFIDLTEEGKRAPYTSWLGDVAQHLRMPIPDFGLPTVDQMVQTLNVIDRAIGTGRPVYVHCRAGLGRTGTVVGCFLVRHGLDGEQSLQAIQALRVNTPYATSSSPETAAQRGLVLKWEKGLWP
ncbi:MAG: dual specificity protein phosphatase family protein [Anaerolineae bacterium]|nr:dual specificity protein phosphatase family protein [Anaerolineae bacterium]